MITKYKTFLIITWALFLIIASLVQIIVDLNLSLNEMKERCVSEHIAVWGVTPKGSRVFYWMDDLFQTSYQADQEL
jgi:hypothetical protein